MLLMKPSFEVAADVDPMFLLEKLERAGRTCYKSEDKITHDSAKKFVAARLKSGHETVIEHVSITVKFVVDRGVSHELVRHRLCAFSQESTRYCNYKGGVTFVIPPWVDFENRECPNSSSILENWKKFLNSPIDLWLLSMARAEREYLDLLKFGWTPQQARSVLPNSLKTEIVVTANLREWRHILRLRTAKDAHPQMQEVMIPLLAELKIKIPVIFDDIQTDREG